MHGRRKSKFHIRVRFDSYHCMGLMIILRNIVGVAWQILIFSQPDFYIILYVIWIQVFDDASHFAKVKLYFYCWRFLCNFCTRIRLLHSVNNCNSSVHIVVIGLLHHFKHRRAFSSIACDNTPSLHTTRCRAIASLIISNSLYLRLSETIWLRLHLSFRCAKESYSPNTLTTTSHHVVFCVHTTRGHANATSQSTSLS